MLLLFSIIAVELANSMLDARTWHYVSKPFILVKKHINMLSGTMYNTEGKEVLIH